MGHSIPQGEGAIFGEGNVAAHCNVMGHSTVCCEKKCWTNQHAILDEDSDGPTGPCIWGASPPGEGQILGLSEHSKALAVFAVPVSAEGIIHYVKQEQIIFWKCSVWAV